MTTQPKAPPPRPVMATPTEIVQAWTAKDAEREARLFLAAPLAWWLDPNRWGDNPNWRDDLPREGFGTTTPTGRWCEHCKEGRYMRRGDTLLCDKCGDYRNVELPIRKMPRCPICRPDGIVSVLAEHGGVVSLWDCARCGCEFTDDGETKKSKKRRLTAARAKAPGGRIDANGAEALLRPPAVGSYITVDQAYPKLPCGCPHSTSIEHHKVKNGATWARCGRCEKWWEPASNSNGRTLAQGEPVHDKDDMQPTTQFAWEKKAALVNAGKERNDGACPSYLCQMPVAKRDGMYYCTSGDCQHSYRGWK